MLPDKSTITNVTHVSCDNIQFINKKIKFILFS